MEWMLQNWRSIELIPSEWRERRVSESNLILSCSKASSSSKTCQFSRAGLDPQQKETGKKEGGVTQQ